MISTKRSRNSWPAFATAPSSFSSVFGGGAVVVDEDDGDALDFAVGDDGGAAAGAQARKVRATKAANVRFLGTMARAS